MKSKSKGKKRSESKKKSSKKRVAKKRVRKVEQKRRSNRRVTTVARLLAKRRRPGPDDRELRDLLDAGLPPDLVREVRKTLAEMRRVTLGDWMNAGGHRRGMLTAEFDYALRASA